MQSSILELTVCTRSAAGATDTPVNNVFVAEDYPKLLSKLGGSAKRALHASPSQVGHSPHP